MKRILYGCLLTVLCLCVGAAPLAKRKLLADKTLSTVGYAAKHPLHAWDGLSRAVSCAVTYDDDTKGVENVAVSIKVATFDSGNSNRDSHMMEVLDGLKYPNVTFVSADVKNEPDGLLRATGNLTFHGVTKPAVLLATRKDSGGKMTLTGEFPVSMTAHNVERPSFLGMKTNDQMTLKFNVVFAL